MRRVMIAFIVVVSMPASARTVGLEKVKCPLSGVEFQAKRDFSGTRFCMRYDTKPIGPIGAPAHIPTCPDHGLVLFKDDFSDDEVKQLREWVTTPEYASDKNETTYFRAAKTMRRLGVDEEIVASAFLRASWQAEGDAAKYQRYLSEAAEAQHRALVNVVDPKAEDAREAQLLLVEMRRLLGHFELATKALNNLKATSAGMELPPVISKIIADEEALIAVKDRGHRYLGDERCAGFDLRGQQPDH